MPNLNYTLRLKNQILLLEADQVEKGQIMKEQFYVVYESLKPSNLLLRTLREVSTSPDLINNIMGTSVGLASGYLSKRMFIGSSGNIIRKLAGYLLQLGVTNIVAQHPDSLRSIGQFLLHKIFSKKETK